MSHSHLPIQHLLKKIESGPRPRRDVRPAWIMELVNEMADLFEPFSELGRVGYECRITDDCWEVGMYLGCMEFVGGKADGDVQPIDFQFDLKRLTQIFSQIDSFHWNAFPTKSYAADGPECSFVVMLGKYRDNPIRLSIYCMSPKAAGTGLRHHSDGTWETV